MMRDIAPPAWRPFLESFSGAHAGWLATAHGMARTGEVTRAYGAIESVSVVGRAPSNAVHIEFVDGQRIYVAHPRAIRVQETADGAERALEIDNVEGESVRVAFRTDALTLEVDDVASAMPPREPLLRRLAHTVLCALAIVGIAEVLAPARPLPVSLGHTSTSPFRVRVQR